MQNVDVACLALLEAVRIQSNETLQGGVFMWDCKICNARNESIEKNVCNVGKVKAVKLAILIIF